MGKTQQNFLLVSSVILSAGWMVWLTLEIFEHRKTLREITSYG